MVKKHRSTFFYLSILLVVSITPVFAHSGRTDGAGGHTNHSTGEYHYHHGYDDHQHYDMNGDGIVDCPYEFKSATIQKDKNYSDYSSSFPNTERAKKVSVSQIIGIVGVVGVILLYLMPIITLIYECVRELIQNLKKKR